MPAPCSPPSRRPPLHCAGADFSRVAAPSYLTRWHSPPRCTSTIRRATSAPSSMLRRALQSTSPALPSSLRACALNRIPSALCPALPRCSMFHCTSAFLSATLGFSSATLALFPSLCHRSSPMLRPRSSVPSAGAPHPTSPDRGQSGPDK